MTDHIHYLRLALSLARLSPPKPTNYCVGAVLIDASSAPSHSASTVLQPDNASSQNPSSASHISETIAKDPHILSTGYTLELPGNTHAEQCCLAKLPSHLPHSGAILYTTMEPCIFRLSGNASCVERILEANAKAKDGGGKGITMVVVGVTEPNTFVKINEGRKRLEDAGVEVMHVGGMEEEILAVAKAGHVEEEAK